MTNIGFLHSLVPGFLIVLILNKRSEAVNNREVFGHREADTMIGKAHQVAIVTIDERISKLRRAYPVKSKHKENVLAAIRAMLEPVAEAVDSITHMTMVKSSHGINKSIRASSVKVTLPSLTARGNRTKRKCKWFVTTILPKSMKLTNVRFNEVKIAVHQLNTRPRK